MWVYLQINLSTDDMWQNGAWGDWFPFFASTVMWSLARWSELVSVSVWCYKLSITLPCFSKPSSVQRQQTTLQVTKHCRNFETSGKKSVLKQVLLLLLLLNAFQFNQKKNQQTLKKWRRISLTDECSGKSLSPSTNWPLNLIHDPEEKPTDALHNTERNTGYLSVHCWVGKMASGIVTLFRSRGFWPGPVWLTTRLANRTS